jgi:hypothetical protein
MGEHTLYVPDAKKRFYEQLRYQVALAGCMYAQDANACSQAVDSEFSEW